MLIERPPAPSHGRRHQAHGKPLLRVFLSFSLVLAAVAGGSPYAPAAAAAGQSIGDGFGDPPTIQYQQAREHAGDKTTFVPGDAVTVPYRPRHGDTAKIDGKAAVALPAGLASGRAMARSPKGSIRAVPDATAASFRLDGGGVEATLALAQAAPASANVLRREVYGYLPYWESGAVSTLNYAVLSTIAYFAVDVDGSGNLVKSGSGWSGWTSSWLTGVINAAHSHSTRVALTVESFAWTSGEASVQTALLSSAPARANLVAQIVGAVTDRGADGVSLDFEPIASGQKDNFVTFVRALRAALDASHPGYEIVFAATGYIANYDPANLLAPGAADAVFIMGYDFRTGLAPTAGSTSPLTSPTVYDLTNAVNAYKAKVPASSIILGLPWYGIAFSTPSNAPNAYNQSGDACPGGTFLAATSVTYSSAAALAATNGHFYDSVEQSAWTAYQLGDGACQTWRELYFDDAQSLAAKYDMINNQDLRGAGIWALGYDTTTNDLTNVLADKFLIGISNLSVGVPGMAPSGTGIDRGRVFSPDADGIHDTMPVHWTNEMAFDDVLVSVFAANGALSGSIDLGAQPAGARSLDWNGKVDGGSAPLPDGQYMIQVRGSVGSAVFYAPSPAPFTAAQTAGFGVIVDTTPTGTYYPLAPVRILDSRIGLGLSGSLVSGQARSFAVAGAHGVPANAIAVTGNLTVTQATALGWVRLGSSTAGANSTINFKAGDERANGVTLGLAADGTLSVLYSSSTGKGGVHVIFDLTGYFVRDANGATFVPVTPTRVVDTRLKQGIAGPLVANKAVVFGVAGLAGVPGNATAVTGNATVTSMTGAGYVSVAPSFVPGTAPGTSTVNFPVGDTPANNLVVPLAGGQLQVEYVSKAGASAQFIFDVTGYFVPGLSGATFVPVAPARLVDSRTGLGFTGPLGTGSGATVAASGRASIDPVAVAVVGNLTVTAQTSPGWLAAEPAQATTTSTLNFPVGDDRANGFVSLFGTNGSLTITYVGGVKTARTQFVVDVMGYYR